MTMVFWYAFDKHLHLTKLKGDHEKKNYTSLDTIYSSILSQCPKSTPMG